MPRRKTDESGPAGGDGRPFTHVFSVLVHEKVDCVFDLLRNLRYFDPESPILLYDGSGGSLPLDADALAELGATAHPAPKRMEWGRLHVFMFDSVEAALGRYAFDAMTVVDSDQLLIRRGYRAAVQRALGDQPRAGLLANPHPNSGLEPTANPITPERARWESIRRRFGHPGRLELPIWIFWPGTVLTRQASEAVCSLRDDPMLAEVVAASGVASEEVVFSTLAVLLGYHVVPRPWTDRFMRWRPPLRSWEVAEAFEDRDGFWLHPVTRSRTDPAREYVQRASNGYHAFTPVPSAPPPAAAAGRRWRLRPNRQ